MNIDEASQAVVSVAQMARMVRLSRARFYQLQQLGIFPLPCYSTDTRRPLYTQQQQALILECRRRNQGVNGRPILFYSCRSTLGPKATRPARTAGKTPKNGAHEPILDAIKSLGLGSLTIREVDRAVAELYPRGLAGIDQGEIIRTLFLHLRSQNTADNVRR